MRTLQSLLRILACATLTATSALPAGATTADERFVVAMQLYHEARFAAAYGRLAVLADEGHAEAARVALLMLRHGPALYRSQWSAHPQQVQYWLDLASRRQPVLVADAGD